jgi:doubled CXXCH motif protein
MPRRSLLRAGLTAPLLLAGLAAGVSSARMQAPVFDHAKHLPLFPGSCTTCHLGAAQTGASFWPNPVACGSCHDGEVKRRITWAPPAAAAASNLRFTHDRHRTATADSVACARCHAVGDNPRVVARRQVERCIGCHVPGSEHLAVDNTKCATCHFPLAEAKGFSAEHVAGFPVPPYHKKPGFGAGGGHAKLAEVKGPDGKPTVAASCATCHAQNFCANCHVNAPEVPAIRALGRDERSLVHHFKFAAPATHEATNFLAVHGRQALRNTASCAACHTQSSCTTCHVGSSLPRPVLALKPPGPGRAPGAQLTRHPPASHVAGWRERHSREASATPRACATCHMQADCLTCHRPDVAQPTGSGDYHPAGFVVKHPSAAYARQSTCTDCHNFQQFCVSCHAQAGLSARHSLGASSFHDARPSFILGHGQAARQSLESCVSCHVERDCTACHSSVGRGFRFNPHGPGFDAARLRKRNPEMCIACHGLAIPGVP